MPEGKLRYRRILLKMSGESLLGDASYGINPAAVASVADELLEVHKTGVQLAVVIGGGNIFRGMREATKSGMDRSVADYMGMLATVMNALAVQDALERNGVDTRVMTAFPLTAVAEPYIRRRAIHHLEAGRVLILAAGTGHPYFTTDTAAALRAAELGAEAILKATTVDGVYREDPKKNPDAAKYETIDYKTFLQENLGVMDATAISLCRECSLPILVFDLTAPGNIMRALYGDKVGTLIGEETP